MLIIKILILVIILLKAAPYGGNNIKPPWFEGGKVSKNNFNGLVILENYYSVDLVDIWFKNKRKHFWNNL